MVGMNRIRGERQSWAAYLLWLTFVGHRWYLGKPSILYLLTCGYFLLGWLFDLFRIPGWVREYNSFVYQREMARRMMARSVYAPGKVTVTSGESGSPAEGEGVPGKEIGFAGSDLPLSPAGRGGMVARLTDWAKESPARLAILGAVGLVVTVSIIIAAISGGSEKADKDSLTHGDGVRGSGVGQESELPMEILEPRGEVVQSPTVNLVGRTEPGARVEVSSGWGEKKEVFAGEDGIFTCQVGLREGYNLLVILAETGGKSTKKEKAIQYQVDEATYKAQCKVIDYRELKKNPDAFKGVRYVAEGNVVQIMESGGQTDMRVKVAGSEWDVLEGIVYVIYAGSVPAYEDSRVRFWGEIEGSHTYTSVAGWKVTLPLVEARYVEVVKR
ncbi:MAG: TM2 domain-containing protein [Candidatus Geothermincolales bacterium]